MSLRKLSALLVSFSLAWVPLSVSFAATVMVGPVATDDGSFGIGEAAASSPLVGDPVLTLSTDPVPPYRRGQGPVLTPTTEVDLTKVSSTWSWMSSDPLTEGCLSCTITNFWQNQRMAYPNLTRPLSYFDDLLKFTAVPVQSNQCLERYDSALVDDGSSNRRGREPSTELCYCLNESKDTNPALGKDDIDKFRKLYEAEAIEKRKREFERNKEKMIEDFAQLRASLYYDRNFNTLSESYYGSNPDNLNSISPCLGDLESLMKSVQASDPDKSCGENGVQDIVNMFEGTSIGLASREVAVNPKDSLEIQARKANLESTLKEIESQMREKSARNLDIYSTLSMFRSLNIDPEVLKEESEKSKNDSSIDIREILRNTLDRSISLATKEAIERRDAPREAVHASAIPDGIVLHDNEVMPAIGSQLVATQNMARQVTLMIGSGLPAFMSPEFLMPSSNKETEPDRRHASGASGAARTTRPGRNYSSLSADEKKLVDSFNLFMSNSPSIRGALKSNSVFDDLGQNSHMAKRMMRFDANDLESSPGRMTAFISAVCAGESNTNLAICTGKFDGVDMKAEMEKFAALANIKASVNLGQRCNKAKDKLLNFCRAFSNVKPPLNGTDAKSFLFEKYGKFPDPNISAVDANEHKMKVAQLSCYFTMRDRAISIGAQAGDESVRCNEVEKKFLKDETAKLAISSNKILGEGCKGSGTPSTVGGAVTNQSWGDSVAIAPGQLDNAVVASSRGSSQTNISRKESRVSRVSSSDIDSFSSKEAGSNGSTTSVGKTDTEASDSNSLPGSDSDDDITASNAIALPFSSNFGNSSPSASPTEKSITPEQMKEIDPVKAAQVSSNDQAIKDLQARLDESERQLKERQIAGDQTGSSQISQLISQMKAQREEMQRENEKLRNEMQQMLAAKEKNSKSAVESPSRSIASNPISTPTPSSLNSRGNGNPIASNGGSGGGNPSFSPAGTIQTGGGAGTVLRQPDDYGYSKNSGAAVTLRLTSGELASAKFVQAKSNQDIFSAILAAPSVPVFVREDGIIVKYVAQLDEDGNPVLDKDGKPVLTSYKFQDPDFDKKVAKRKPAAVEAPAKVVKPRKFIKYDDVKATLESTLPNQ